MEYEAERSIPLANHPDIECHVAGGFGRREVHPRATVYGKSIGQIRTARLQVIKSGDLPRARMQKSPSALSSEGSSRLMRPTVTLSDPRRTGTDVGASVVFRRSRSGSGKMGCVSMMAFGRLCCLEIQFST